MQIDVREAAQLLTISEKTVYRWIRSGTLPAYRINGQYRFSRTELLEWATARRINVAPEIFADAGAGETVLPSLEEAIRAGGIHYRVSGETREEVLAQVVDLMQLPPEVNRPFLLSVLLARESLGSTGIGDGIAIPHVRNPIVLHIPRPTITLCFLEQPIEFGSIDGAPVRTLFTVVSPTVRAHLHLLSRLTWALRRPAFREPVMTAAARDEILAAAGGVEK
jgi:PTS system nitrogen regulatory IIA component